MSQKGGNSKNTKKFQLLPSNQKKLSGSNVQEMSRRESKISAIREPGVPSAKEGSSKVNHAGILNGKYCNLMINASGEQILAHIYIIEARCKGLLSKILSKKHKKNGVYIYESKQYEANFLKELVKYLYSDDINLKNLSLLEVVLMIQVSMDHNISRLNQISKKYLHRSLTLENIYDALHYSHKLNVKEAEDVCMDFAVRNHEAFIMNPILTEKLRDVALLQKETILYSQMRSNSTVAKDIDMQIPPSTIVSDFKSLFESSEGSDLSIVTIESVIPCHRAIVASASSILMDLVDTCPKDQHLVFPETIQPVHADVCYMLFRYVYYNGIDFDPKEATQLIILAKKLQVLKLVSHCQTCILANVNKDTISYSLQVAFDPIFDDQPNFQEELKEICQRVFFDNFSSIDFSSLQNMNPVVSTYLLISLQKHLESSISFKPGLPSPIKLSHSSYLSDVPSHIHQKKSSLRSPASPTKLIDSPVSQDTPAVSDSILPESPSVNGKKGTPILEKVLSKDKYVSPLTYPQEQDEQKQEFNKSATIGNRRKVKPT